MDSKLREALSAFTADLEFAIWFGSTARGEATPLSDIDVAVYFQKSTSKEKRFQGCLDIAGEIEARFLRTFVDVVDLNSAPVVLAYHVLREGRLLFCRNARLWNDFQVQTLKFYFDLQPMWRVQRRIMRQQIEEGSFLG